MLKWKRPLNQIRMNKFRNLCQQRESVWIWFWTWWCLHGSFSLKSESKKGKWHSEELEALLNKLTLLEDKLGELSFPLKSQPSVPPLRELLKTPISDENEDSGVESVFAFPFVWLLPIQGVAQPPRYDGINMDDIAKLKKVVVMYGPQSHYTKELLSLPVLLTLWPLRIGKCCLKLS